MSPFEKLTRHIQPLRVKLLEHPLYGMIDSLTNLRIFMEYHVFAVWDFMSLLKSLQRSQTSVEIPWRPRPNPTTSRFINEIVLSEESDEDGAGGYISHFALYRSAMKECGASTSKIDDLVEQVGKGVDIRQALLQCGADARVVEFVKTTWSFIESDRPHRVAAAFTFGREDVLPGIFRSCVVSLGSQLEAGLPNLKYYLERHIELDEDRHAPMAIKVMHELCGNDRRRWEEASDAVKKALLARISLWDGIVSAIRDNQDSASTSTSGDCPSEPDRAVA
ncbi:MAG: DUF3050 domain-containing protein [Candidatus Sulfotelmatobacter sp.]